MRWASFDVASPSQSKAHHCGAAAWVKLLEWSRPVSIAKLESHSSTQNNINKWIGSSSQEMIHHCARMGEIYFEEAEVTANCPMSPCCVGKDVAERSNG
eukprot:scaffold4408_cov160-Skeletonema_dohrnii-CCMP3373.AAC.1